MFGAAVSSMLVRSRRFCEKRCAERHLSVPEHRLQVVVLFVGARAGEGRCRFAPLMEPEQRWEHGRERPTPFRGGRLNADQRRSLGRSFPPEGIVLFSRFTRVSPFAAPHAPDRVLDLVGALCGLGLARRGCVRITFPRMPWA